MGLRFAEEILSHGAEGGRNMKQGNTMHDIMQKLVLQQNMKKDYDVSPFRLEMTADAQILARGISERPFECTKTMHEQIAQRTGDRKSVV